MFVISLVIAATGLNLVGETKANFPRPKGYVNDFANVVDPATSGRLTALCTELDQKTGAQIAIVTIQTLNGSSIEDYALQLFNEWGIGHKEDNRGILILLSLSDRRYRIEIGRGFEPLFPNGRVAKIGAEMIPDLRSQHYSQALFRCTRRSARLGRKGCKTPEQKSLLGRVRTRVGRKVETRTLLAHLHLNQGILALIQT